MEIFFVSPLTRNVYNQRNQLLLILVCSFVCVDRGADENPRQQNKEPIREAAGVVLPQTVYPGRGGPDPTQLSGGAVWICVKWVYL